MGIQHLGSVIQSSWLNNSRVFTDIHSTFLQGLWPQDEHPGYICFTGIMIDMICEIDPSWNKDGKKKYLYGELIKAVYGNLLAAVIFYNKLTQHLKNQGFEMNKYHKCTFNKMVNGDELIVQFHVDNLKASHKDKKVLDDFMHKLTKQFGNEAELSETTGKVH